MKKKLIESDYQRALLLRVARVFPKTRFFRRNTGLIRMEDGRRFRSAVPGQCDIYAIARNGLHVEIELKNIGGRLSASQEAWAAWCAEWHVPHIVLRVLPDELPTQTIDRWIDALRTIWGIDVDTTQWLRRPDVY